MKLSLLTLPRLTLLLPLALLLAAGTSSALAELKFEKTEISHTAKAEETQFTATYTFENAGKKDITISKVNTSCGCTTAEMDKKKYAPGEKGSLSATFKYEDRQGYNMKTISVETTEGMYNLILSVEIPEYVKLDVPLVTWEQGEELTPKSIKVSLHPDAPFGAFTAEFENPVDFTGALKETTPEDQKGKGKPREFTFEVTPVSTEKTAKSLILFKTDFPKDQPRVYKAFTMVKPARS